MNFISSLYNPLYNNTTPVIYHTTPIVPPNFYYNTTAAGNGGDLSNGFNSNNPSMAIDEDDVSRVKLSRDDLLKYTSQEYDDHIKRISQKRPLTEKEHKESKKQRRLIKNREYAQISRNKKKTEYTQLSVQIDQLNAENSELKERVDHLETENKRLKDENRKLLELQTNSHTLLAISTEPLAPAVTLLSPLSPVITSPPMTPQFQVSPPETPSTSSEESTSFDLFSEDSDLFASEWASDFPKIPYTFMAVFFCLLLFYPSSMVQFPKQPVNHTTFVVYPPVLPIQTVPNSNGYNGHRHLLTADQETNELENEYRERNESRHSPKTVLTMDDVLNDEMKITDSATITEGSKENYILEINNTASFPLLISNHSISFSY
jgi:cell division protein FtsB